MTKVNLGDYVYVDHYHKNGTVISDRGGHVGRWFIRFDDGSDGHVSSRDCTVIKYLLPFHMQTDNRRETRPITGTPGSSD